MGSKFIFWVFSDRGRLGSKFTRSQISPFKVGDIFRLFHYPLCHSNNQEINRKPKILLQFLPSGNVIRNTSYDVTMTSWRKSELGLCSWKRLCNFWIFPTTRLPRINIYKQLITQLLSCVGAGALLGLAMIDILPELREKISSIPKEYTHAESSQSAHADSHHSDFHSEEESGFFSDHYPLGMFIFWDKFHFRWLDLD